MDIVTKSLLQKSLGAGGWIKVAADASAPSTNRPYVGIIVGSSAATITFTQTSSEEISIEFAAGTSIAGNFTDISTTGGDILVCKPV